MGKTKFVLNRQNFRTQVLKGEGVKAMLVQQLGKDAVSQESHTRARARVYGDMKDEAENGTLSRRLGGTS
jgi:hypothetical protein